MKVAIIGDIHFMDNSPRCRKDDYNQSLLNKISFLFKEHDIIICLGDLFDKASTSDAVLNTLFLFLYDFELRGKRFYTIYGNHDLYKYNVSLVNKTSLGLLDLFYRKQFGRSVILDELSIGGFTFKQLPFSMDKPSLASYKSSDILLGHYFYQVKFDSRGSYMESDIITEAKYLFLGHDHTIYGEMDVNGTKILRPGSLCRTTYLEVGRRVCYYSLLLVDFRLSYSLLDICVDHGVFLVSNKVKVIESEVPHIEDLSISINDGALSMDDTLCSLGASERHIGYINNFLKELELGCK